MLWPFGIFYGHLVYFSPFWHVAPKKIWQPWREQKSFWLKNNLRRRGWKKGARWMYAAVEQQLVRISGVSRQIFFLRQSLRSRDRVKKSYL
jgi:hypothetical protein